VSKRWDLSLVSRRQSLPYPIYDKLGSIDRGTIVDNKYREGKKPMRRDMQLWMPPSIGIIVYPGLIVSFGWSINNFHRTMSPFWAIYALLTMLLAMSIPALALRALIRIRHEERAGLVRGILYLMFAAPPLFTLTFSLTRIAGVDQYLAVIWIFVWVAIGLMLYLKEGRGKPGSPAYEVARLRIVHGAVALCLLCGFLIAHLINHDLAVWSVQLHGTVIKFLRLWYRSELVQPILLAMLVIMICTGVGHGLFGVDGA
jgi:hypothetical protein